MESSTDVVTDASPKERTAEKDQLRSIKNPSVVLGLDHGTWYGLAFTGRGMVRGPVVRDKAKAITALEAGLGGYGVKAVHEKVEK